MVENKSGIKAAIEKETLPELNLLMWVSEITAAGVYLSEGRLPNIPITPCSHAAMQPCSHEFTNDQCLMTNDSSTLLFHNSIIPVVSAANLSTTWETGQLFFATEIFGQYISRIFYEINRGSSGGNLRK
jgi:hypothetical protein